MVRNSKEKEKLQYAKIIATMTDAELEEECEQKIWLSAYANNNQKADFHWQCNACYTEAQKRDVKAVIYQKAYETIRRSI